MSFKKLIRLNSLSTNAFLMNEIVSLIENLEEIPRERAKKLLEEALKYITLINSGNEYLEIMRGENEVENTEDLPNEDLEESLEAYTNSVEALMKYGDTTNIDDVNEIIIASEREITNILRQKNIIRENLRNSYLLFDSIGSLLLTKANELSNEKKTIFKVY